MSVSRILVVEDEQVLREGLVDLLQDAGYQTEAVADGEAALARGTDPSFHLILLDWMLPRMDGLTVCRKLRELRPGVPILMLTARGAEEDKVSGLRTGADDYVTKPFGIKELLARIEALGRRLHAGPDTLNRIRGRLIVVDLGRREAELSGETTKLTPKETEILRWLYQHRTRAVSRAELLEMVWDAPGDLQTRTVDMTIANLRQKIEPDPQNPQIVITIKGVGYAWGDGDGE